MKKVGFAVAVMAMVAGAASAQEQSVDWTGAYIGAFAEGSMAQFDMHDKDCWYCASGSFSQGSAEFGVKAGYDQQVGSVVYGASLSYSTGPNTASNVWWDDGYFESELKSMVALRGRVGYAAGENLLYVSGGVLSGDFSGYLAYESGNQGANPTDIAIDSERRLGAAVGAGFARMLSDNVAFELEAEYQTFQTGYSFMDEDDNGGLDGIQQEDELGEIGFGLSRTVVRAGISYRF